MKQILKKRLKIISIFTLGILLFLFSQGGDSQVSPAIKSSSNGIESATESRIDGSFPDRPPRNPFPPERMQGRGRGQGPRDDFPPELGPPPEFGPPGRRPGGPGRFGGPGGFNRPAGRTPFRDRMESQERMESLRHNNPELADTIEKLRRLRYRIDTIASEEYQKKDAMEKNSVKKRLQPLLEEEFELDLKRQNMEIDIMEKRIQQIRATLQRRNELRSRIIDQKMDLLVKNPPLQPPVEPDSMEIESATPEQ